MRLETARKTFETATEQTLEEVFGNDLLRGEFIIIQTDDDNFLQAGGEGDGPYILEYREAGEQYRATAELTKPEVKEAFLDYLAGRIGWRANRQWKSLSAKKGCSTQAGIIMLLVSLALIVTRLFSA